MRSPRLKHHRSLNSNSDCGGLGISVISSNSEYTIKYDKCHFTSITNNHENSPNNHGGVLQLGFTNNSNTNIEITECEFNSNKVKGGHGGAVSLRTTKSILIRDSKFTSNIAPHESDTNGNKGFGGAIYISTSFETNANNECTTEITISGCTFENNQAYQGYGIYLQGTTSCNPTITLNDNHFTNDRGTETHPQKGGIIASEITTINKENIESNNEFVKSNEEIQQLIFVDNIGNPLPDATPTPSPLTDPNYINNTFTNSAGTDQVQAGLYNINEISGCRFTNIHTGKNYYIRINKEIPIYNNIFENTELIGSDTLEAGIFFSAFNGRITLTNCKFIRISGKGGEGYVFTSNGNNNIQATMNECEFIDCGSLSNTDLPLITILNSISSITFNECNFTFNDLNRNFRVLDIRTNDVNINGCKFTKCGPNTLYLAKDATETSPQGTFQFRNNYVTLNEGTFINGMKIRNKPIIEGNTFEQITLTNNYMITISHDQTEIEFNNNTFSSIEMSGSSNCECGGIGISTISSNSEYTIKYIKCIFKSITNNHDSGTNNHGGVIEQGFTSNSNTNLEIIGCEFNGNTIERGHGGSLAIRSSKNILIQNSTFSSNSANQGNENENNQGFGGAIYISTSFESNGAQCSTGITITGCSFSNNRAYQGYGIYIQGTTSCDPTININDNQFNNDQGTISHPKGSGTIASEITSINIDDIENSNSFTNTNNDIKHLIFVDNIGNPLPDATPTPSQSPTESATETPSQSPTETPTPTQVLYDSSIIDFYQDGNSNKFYHFVFDCPIQDGTITIYLSCKDNRCNQISSSDKVWYKLSFERGEITNIEHQNITIHNNIPMANFVPSSEINYNGETNTLTSKVDSVNMIYVESDIELKCYVPPITPRATLSQSPTETPSQSPTETPSQSPTETPTQSPTETSTQESSSVESSEQVTSTQESSSVESSEQVTSTQESSSVESSEQVTSTQESSSVESSEQVTSTQESSSVESSEQVTSTQESSSVESSEQITPDKETPVIPETPTESLPGDIIIVEDEDLKDYRYDKVINDTTSTTAVKIEIKVTNFINITYNNNGGAVHIINSGLTCKDISFKNCSSVEGAGGGIFISNTHDERVNPIVLEYLDFSECKAKYGGAAYIYSSSKKCSVQILHCTFTRNVATAPEDETQSALFGGSALFLTTRKGKVRSNNFIDNEGSESVVKLYNNFDRDDQSNSAKIIKGLDQNDEDLLIVSNCKFTISEGSDCSLFHLQGKDATKLLIKDCVFDGVLAPEAHHIDGLNINDEKPKLSVKNCKFSTDLKKAFNLQIRNNKFLPYGKNIHYLESNNYLQSKKSAFSSSLKSLFIPAVISLFVIFIIFIVTKKTMINEFNNNENDGMIIEDNYQL